MAKKGVLKITGNKSPKTGEKTIYNVIEWYPDTPLQERKESLVTWELFRLRDNGKFTTTHIKKQGIGQFTFGKDAWQFTFRIEGYTHEPEGKEPMSIIVKPQNNGQQLIPKEKDILGVKLTYQDGSGVTKTLSYMDRLRATAKCQGLEGEHIIFSLWEDDETGKAHNKKNQLILKSPPTMVDSKGYARWNFTLLNTYIALVNKREDDKKKHEYYVTTEYNGKQEASDNVNVNNPEYKVPASHPKPASLSVPKSQPNPNTPKGSTRSNSPNNQPDKKGVISKIKLTDKNGKEFTKNPKFGETIKISIEAKDVVGKKYTLKIWEHDLIGNNDLLYNRVHTFKADKQDVLIPLTDEMQKTGEVGNNPKNPDSGEYWKGGQQEIFAEIIFLNIETKSQTIDVDIKETPKKQNNGRSPAKKEKTELEKHTNGKCPNCDKPVTAEDLKTIFPNASESDRKITAATYTKYMKDLGMNTCWNKAHFFAQARVESGTSLTLKKGESLNYSAEDLPVKFSAFRVDPNKKYNAKTNGPNNLAYKYGRSKQNNYVADEKMIAKIAYSNRKSLGNTGGDDGWNFRGRGMVQLTGRTNYTNINVYSLRYLKIDILKDFEKVGSSMEVAVLTSMGYLHRGGMPDIANGCTNEDLISVLVGNDVFNKKGESVNHIPKQKAFDEITSKVFMVNKCTYGKQQSKKEPSKKGRAPWIPYALGEIGQKAILGDKNNPRINEYFNASTNGKGLNESTNWCGAFTSWCMVQAGYTPPPVSCRAAMWQFWKQDKPIYGSAAVIDWDSNESASPEGKGGAVGGSGHITFVIGISKNGNHYYCVGGNQGGTKGARTVKISKYSKNDIDWFVIPPNYSPEADEYKLKVMTSEADIDSSSSTRS